MRWHSLVNCCGQIRNGQIRFIKKAKSMSEPAPSLLRALVCARGAGVSRSFAEDLDLPSFRHHLNSNALVWQDAWEQISVCCGTRAVPGAVKGGGSREGGCARGSMGGLWRSGPPAEVLQHWDQENTGGGVSDRF